MSPRNNQNTVVKYRDLILRARCEGLVSISTELIQIPNDANGQVAIARACVTFEEDGRTRSFEDYGDASPSNVTEAIRPHIIRMALTRAKARCLRDALGLGDVAAEELSNYSEGGRQHRPATGGGAISLPPINESGSQCPYCQAPHGSRHLRSCPTIGQAAA